VSLDYKTKILNLDFQFLLFTLSFEEHGQISMGQRVEGDISKVDETRIFNALCQKVDKTEYFIL
jgi:hypothetical protein